MNRRTTLRSRAATVAGPAFTLCAVDPDLTGALIQRGDVTTANPRVPAHRRRCCKSRPISCSANPSRAPVLRNAAGASIHRGAATTPLKCRGLHVGRRRSSPRMMRAPPAGGAPISRSAATRSVEGETLTPEARLRALETTPRRRAARRRYSPNRVSDRHRGGMFSGTRQRLGQRPCQPVASSKARFGSAAEHDHLQPVRPIWNRRNFHLP